jgi:hypothetical protein
MIQGEVGGLWISKNVLRHRIYSVAFDYFSIAPQTPLHSGAALRNDIRSLVSFWQALYADSKYIRKKSLTTQGKFRNLSNEFVDWKIVLVLGLNKQQVFLATHTLHVPIFRPGIELQQSSAARKWQTHKRQ